MTEQTTCPVVFAHRHPDAEKQHHITKTKFGPVSIACEVVTLESVNFDKCLLLAVATVIEGAVPHDFDPAPAHKKAQEIIDVTLAELKKKFTGGFYDGRA